VDEVSILKGDAPDNERKNESIKLAQNYWGLGLSIVRYAKKLKHTLCSVEYRAMDKVQQPSNFECYTPPFEAIKLADPNYSQIRTSEIGGGIEGSKITPGYFRVAAVTF
jgi:hypothetical protein